MADSNINLHELNRKELKELCSRNNIRTAGVKHEDLVRLLHNKLYPQTPRSMKTRGPKVVSPGKEDGDPYKTPGKTVGKGRNLRSATLPREDVAASARKNSGPSRKPLASKSNTMSSRRTNLSINPRGVEQDATQENFVRRLCQINGLSPLSRKGPPDTASKASRLALVNSNGKTKDLTSPRPSEGDANSTAEVEPSEAGSDVSRRISEIATDAGPETLSDFSDADEFRSVSSEPVSKPNTVRQRRTQESSKLSQSGLSSFIAGSWDTSDHSRITDNVVDGHNCDSREGHNSEIIFPEFSEGSNFLVGDNEGLDLSFLHSGGADPELIAAENDHDELQVSGKDHQVNEFDAMDSPMARDYVNYTRGTDTETKENPNADSDKVSVGEFPSEHGENLTDLDGEGSVGAASIDAADKQEDSTAVTPAENEGSKVVGHANDDAPGNEGAESKPSCSGSMHSDHSEPNPEDVEDGPEIHSELPCFESNSPPFDSKDFCVAKKLVFEPEANSSPIDLLQQTKPVVGEEEVSNSRNGDEGLALSAPKTIEDEDCSSPTKPVSSLDEPASKDHGLAETVPETLQSTSESTPSGRAQDEADGVDQEGGIAPVEDVNTTHDAVIPSAGYDQESELADTEASSEGLNTLAAEDQDALTLDKDVSHPETDMPRGELDRSNSPAHEKKGPDVKARDGESPSTSKTAPNYSKEEGEKESLSCPLSIILWCCQWCSPISRNRTPRLGS